MDEADHVGPGRRRQETLKSIRVERILIRNLPEGTKAQLAVRADRNHRSMEAEARVILGEALQGDRVTIVDFLAHPESVDVDFEPERLGASARTAEL